MKQPDLGNVLNRVEDDLGGEWIEAYAKAGTDYLEEEYLARYAAFLSFLDRSRPDEAPHTVTEYEPRTPRQGVGRIGLSKAVEIPYEKLPEHDSHIRH